LIKYLLGDVFHLQSSSDAHSDTPQLHFLRRHQLRIFASHQSVSAHFGTMYGSETLHVCSWLWLW